MTDQVETTLYHILHTYGPGIVEDPGRCRGLLRDLCGQYKQQVNLLLAALEDGVPSELLAVSDRALLEPLIARLTKRLIDEKGLAQDKARWAVSTWASVLCPNGLTSESVGPEKSQTRDVFGAQLTLRSALPLKVFISPPARPVLAGEWRYVGSTPGELKVPLQHRLHVIPLQLSSNTFSQLAADLADLGPLHSLRLMPETRPADADLARLATSLALNVLDLTGCGQITEKGLAGLCCLTNLEALSLRDCRALTDNGVRRVADLPYLACLDISGCQNVTDSGVHHLLKLERLEDLYVTGCSRLSATVLSGIAQRRRVRVHQTGYAKMPGT